MKRHAFRYQQKFTANNFYTSMFFYIQNTLSTFFKSYPGENEETLIYLLFE